MSAKKKASNKTNDPPFLTHPDQAKILSSSIIGIDASLTSTGWCHLSKEGMEAGHFGSKKFGPERLRELFDKLDDVLGLALPTLAVVEGYSYGSPNNREALAEWGGLVRILLWDRKIPTLIVAPQTLKKFVLPGGGSNDKDMILLESFKRWGVEFANNDECDAHALAQLGRLRLRLEMLDLAGTSQDLLPEPQRMKEAAATAAPLIFPPPFKPSPGPIRARSK